MKSNINIILFLVALTIVSCKKEVPFKDFKFSEKGIVVHCENQNNALLSEAIFSFENDIVNYYAQVGKTSLATAYFQFIKSATSIELNYADIVSPHSVKIFEALKNEDDLWDAENPYSYINYKGETLSCITSKF